MAGSGYGKHTDTSQTEPKLWQHPNSGDYLAVKNLYQSLLPPLVQSAEFFLNIFHPDGYIGTKGILLPGQQ